MLEMFKRARKYMLILALPYLLVVFMTTYRIDYRITTPGDLDAIGSYIELEAETYPQENPISSVYVMSIPRPTFFQFMASTLSPSHSQSALPESQRHISDRANFRSGQVARNTSIDASFITSLEALGMRIEYEEQRIVRLIYDYMDGDLDIGDIVLSINGNTDLDEAIQNAPCEEWATFEVERDEAVKEVEVRRQERDGKCVFGFTLSTYYKITDAEVPLEVRSSLVGGPSGGLMQTLHIYNALSEFDLTQGLKISGTGTINIDGTAGSVGSIREKVYTAHRSGVDVFFVPTNPNVSNDNYAQALRAHEEISGSDMQIVPVEHFTDAINFLLQWHGGMNNE